MDSSRPHIIDFAAREPHGKNATNTHAKAFEANHNEKQDQDTDDTVGQLRTLFAAHDSKLQAIRDACSAAQGSAVGLELVLKELSRNSGKPLRQVRNLIATHDMNLEAVRIACECAQECSVELLQDLVKFCAGGGR
jgi:uncharacterized protein (DUF3084 family)